jgi:alcohol dehydrogenase (cytochrome c)
VRKGDNLYSSSVVALDPNTGKLKWHYQFTPNDTHDWDSTEDMMLVDRGGRKLLLHADRNGFLYELDRVTGKFVTANAFVRQTWNRGFDASGRPQPVAGWNASAEGSIAVFPNLVGGTNFQSPSYDPATGWMYVATAESGQRFFTSEVQYEAGRQFQGGRGVAVDEPSTASIKALDPDTGRTMWEFPLFQGSLNNGVLATGGGVLFAASRDGNLIALNSRTGALLWKFQTGGAMASAPMSYSVDGRQYVAVASGNVLYSFALPK